MPRKNTSVVYSLHVCTVYNRFAFFVISLFFCPPHLVKLKHKPLYINPSILIIFFSIQIFLVIFLQLPDRLAEWFRFTISISRKT